MEIREMKHSDIETRLAELDTELTNVNPNDENADEKIDEINSEVEELKEREEEIKEEVKAEEEKRKLVMKEMNVVETRKENRKMNQIETRNTPEYLDAFVEMLKGKATEEQRALLTTHATNGTIAVPTYVSDKIWTSWESSKLLSRIRKVYMQGDYQVGYEDSATGAVKHTEGSGAVAEEQLVIRYVKFTAEYIKKWISISRSVMALRGQQFIDYLYDEIGYQLAKEAEREIIDDLMNSDLSAQVTAPIDENAVLTGLTALSEESANTVAIMSRETYAKIKGIRTTTGARVEDPFESLEVIKNNNVSDGIVIVDLDSVEANFPNGEEFEYHFDELTLMTENKIRILGEVMFDAHLVRKNGAVWVTAE